MNEHEHTPGDYDPIEDNDPDGERGVCMNCGAEMDYSPWHPWCADCDRADEDDDE